jgi:hypothetical protein
MWRRWWMTRTSPVPPCRSGNSTLVQDTSRPLDGKEQAVARARNSLTARTAVNGASCCRFLAKSRGALGRERLSPGMENRHVQRVSGDIYTGLARDRSVGKFVRNG